MRFFSKITFLCNLCFLIFVVMNELEKNPETLGSRDAIIPLPAVEGTLAILGLASVLINIVFSLTCLVFVIVKKPVPVAKWLVRINILFLILQFFYFKLY